jgi:uncharacterized membrane protein
MRALSRTALASILAIVALSGLAGSTVLAADVLTVSVPYPEVIVGPGTKVTFDVTVKTTTAGRVDLFLSEIPSGWTAVVHGGSTDITAVQTNGKDPVTATVEVTVPADATGDKQITLRAEGLGQTIDTALVVRVQASAAGEVKLTTDVPSQKGTASTTFTFNVTIDNSTSQDLTFSVTAQGPDGWTTAANLTGSATTASAIVKAGETSSASITANPPDGVAAGQYPIDVTATAGGKTYPIQLSVEITGSYTLAMSTPTQVLSNSGSAGNVTDQQLTLTNNGTAPITNVKVSASGPSADWKFDFDQPTIASIAAGDSATVTAKVTPASNAIAGDYNLTFNASDDQSASASQTIRFTVQTSIFGGVVAVVIVVLLAAGLWYVFRRYGRR